jgi:hypothetical protein
METFTNFCDKEVDRGTESEEKKKINLFYT